MSWSVVKLTDTAYSIEDSAIVPGSILMIGSIVLAACRWRVEIMRMDCDDVKGDFEKFETAKAFVESAERLQRIKEETCGHAR